MHAERDGRDAPLTRRGRSSRVTGRLLLFSSLVFLYYGCLDRNASLEKDSSSTDDSR